MKKTDYATIADIARLLGASVRTVRDRYVHAPGFPQPAIAPSSRKRKWRVSSVLEWAKPKERQ
jgi:DNA-binding LacI/PurR family transcriptional regulator